MTTFFGDLFVKLLEYCRPDLESIAMADVQHGDAKSDTSSEQVNVNIKARSLTYSFFRVMLITALWGWI